MAEISGFRDPSSTGGCLDRLFADVLQGVLEVAVGSSPLIMAVWIIYVYK